MADGATLTINEAALARTGRAFVTRELKAARSAVSVVARDLEQQIEAVTRVVAGGNLWRAWKSGVYPRSGLSYAPAGEVFVPGKQNGRTVGAITFWTQPGEVRGRHGQYLAIPLPAAGALGRNRNVTPGEWEQAHGVRLRFVYRPGRASLLVVDGASLTGAGRVSLGRKRMLNGAGRAVGGTRQTTVPIFVLIPLVRFRNSIALEPLVRVAGRRLVQTFLSAPR